MAPLLQSGAQSDALIQIDLSPRKPAPKPAWLKARAPMGETFHNLKKLARDLNLHTVCESAHCPNIGECWNHKTATFMMLGNLCTRRCGFCAVPKGKPEPIDHSEPARVAYAVAQLGLAHAVITSVNRDDDNLGAAQAFVNVIAEIRRQAPGMPGRSPHPRLPGRSRSSPHGRRRAPRDPQPQHRDRPAPLPRREIRRPLRALASNSSPRPSARSLRTCVGPIVTKTGIIVGMGEEMHELLGVFRDLADRKVDILTIGQYLRPSRDHLPMSRFYTPEEFAFLKHEALQMGFRHVESGPLVRSSYHAHEQAQSTGLA